MIRLFISLLPGKSEAQVITRSLVGPIAVKNQIGLSPALERYNNLEVISELNSTVEPSKLRCPAKTPLWLGRSQGKQEDKQNGELGKRSGRHQDLEGRHLPEKQEAGLNATWSFQ